MKKKDNKYDFYDEVIINSSDSKYKEINGLKGNIMGMDKNSDGTWSYAVSINGVSWSINESELTPTGKKAKREDFYDGNTMKVDSKGNIISVDIKKNKK